MTGSKDIYGKLREARRARGLTVNRLAEKMGEDYQKVGRIERGKRSLTLEYLLKISKALETPVTTFLENEKGEEPQNEEERGELLNEIVVRIEENITKLPLRLNPHQKGQLIAKIYQTALRFPADLQRLYVACFLEGLLSIEMKE